jgi:hypothetical protein
MKYHVRRLGVAAVVALPAAYFGVVVYGLAAAIAFAGLQTYVISRMNDANQEILDMLRTLGGEE